MDDKKPLFKEPVMIEKSSKIKIEAPSHHPTTKVMSKHNRQGSVSKQE